MAILRRPMICPFCGGEIHFKYNKLSEEQIRSGWCGDQGGDYDNAGHAKVCKENQRQNKIDSVLGVTQSESVKNSLEFAKSLEEFREKNKDKIEDFIRKTNGKI